MQLVLALMALLALGPFLHAHYGASRLTGFHVDGMGVVSTPVHTSSEAAYFTTDSDEESAAIGINASHTRQSLTDDGSEDDTSPVWFLLAAILGVCVSVQTRTRSAAPLAIRPHSAYRAGFPPLAHAPPSIHC